MIHGVRSTYRLLRVAISIEEWGRIHDGRAAVAPGIDVAATGVVALLGELGARGVRNATLTEADDPDSGFIMLTGEGFALLPLLQRPKTLAALRGYRFLPRSRPVS